MFWLIILAIAMVIARIAISVGFRIGFVDHPNARKQHPGPVPLAGGIAIFATILTGHLVFGIDTYSGQSLAIATLVLLVGVFDDYRHINPWVRLGIQYAAGIMLATWGGVAISNVGDLLAMGNIPLLFLTVPLTALSVAGLSNAYNMIDGIDGLAATLLALPLLVLSWLAATSYNPFAGALLLMLVPLFAFLFFNLGPDNRLLPKMFLGDSGSITLGFLLTTSLIFFSQGESALIKPVTALWLVSVPLMDMLATMLRRAKSGLSVMEADRLHLHHTLIDRGLSSRQTLLIITVYAITTSLVGIVLDSTPDYISMGCYFALFFGHCLFVVNSGKVRKCAPDSLQCS